jgi:hypothetical protein
MDIFDSKYSADILDITIPALQVQTGTFVHGSYQGGRVTETVNKGRNPVISYMYINICGYVL